MPDTRDERLRQAAADVRALLDAPEAHGAHTVEAALRKATDMMVRAVMREAVIEAVEASGLLSLGGRVHGGIVRRDTDA